MNRHQYNDAVDDDCEGLEYPIDCFEREITPNPLSFEYEKAHLPHGRWDCYRLYAATLSSVSPGGCNIAVS
jgi:hypothetical protein